MILRDDGVQMFHDPFADNLAAAGADEFSAETEFLDAMDASAVGALGQLCNSTEKC